MTRFRRIRRLLEVFRVEFLPGLTRELVEPNATHPLDHEAPALDNDRRSWTLVRDDVGPGIVRLEAMLAIGHTTNVGTFTHRDKVSGRP